MLTFLDMGAVMVTMPVSPFGDGDVRALSIWDMHIAAFLAVTVIRHRYWQRHPLPEIQRYQHNIETVHTFFNFQL